MARPVNFSSATGASGNRTVGVIGTPYARSIALSAAKKLPVATWLLITAIACAYKVRAVCISPRRNASINAK